MSREVPKLLLLLRRTEQGFATLLFGLLVLLPFVDMVYRLFANASIPGLIVHTPFLLMVLTAAAGGLASAGRAHLQMGLNIFPEGSPIQKIFDSAKSFFLLFISTALFVGGIAYVLTAVTPEEMGGVFPLRFYVVFFPLAFLLILVRWFPTFKTTPERVLAVLGILLGLFLSYRSLDNILYFVGFETGEGWFSLGDFWYGLVPQLVPILVVLLILLVFAGMPIFVVLGGIALLFFAGDGVGAEAVVISGTEMLKDNMLPAIALFTLTGYLLSASRAGKRFVMLFKAGLGWMPGGLVLAAVLVSAFFTTFTGASGVTILALGGLLFEILRRSARMGDSVALGVVTSTPSIGLLFPPSLAIIIYGSVAQIPINELFVAGLGPGLLLILVMFLFGVIYGVRRKLPRPRANGRYFAAGLKASWPELLMPLVVVVLYFSGTAGLVETAAFSVVYVLVLEVFIRKEIDAKLLWKTVQESLVIIGGVMIILFVAKGLSSFIIDTGLPQQLTDWMAETVTSPILFLLLLNVILLVVGCLMDLFSALFVVLPLVLPLGVHYGIDPMHLSMIFLTNLGLGFITPPVGMNLFLATYRFGQPLVKVIKAVLPFFALQLVVVLLVTWIPGISRLFLPAVGQ